MNKLRKVISLLAVFLMIFGNMPLALADDGNVSYIFKYGGHGTSGVSMGGTGTSLFDVVSTDASFPASVAFCTDYSTYINTSTLYARKELEDASYYSNADAARIRAILFHSVPHKSYNSVRDMFAALDPADPLYPLKDITDDEIRGGTQAAIWYFSNNVDKSSDSHPLANQFRDYLKGLSGMGSQFAQAAVVVEYDVTQNGNTSDVLVRFKADKNNADGSKVDLVGSFDNKQNAGSAVFGAQSYSDGWFRILVSGLPNNASFDFQATGSQTTSFDIWFYDPKGGRGASQSLVGPHSGVTPISGVSSFSNKKGAVQVRKVVDGLDTYNPDFTIRISGGPDNITKDITVKANAGYADVTGLYYGNYTVTEINVPAGFTAGAISPNSFTLNGENRDNGIKITVNNTQVMGTLTVNKTVTGPNVWDSDLSKNFSFKVVGPAPATTERSVSASDATNGTLSLPYGDYTISEVDVPNGFSASLDKTSFTIGPDATEVTVNATNTKLQGTLTVDKNVTGPNVTDADRAFNYSFKVVGPAPSGKQWSVSASHNNDGTLNLPYGDYTIAEVNVPDDFTAALDKTSFTIGDNATNIVVTATNTKKTGKLIVDKTVLGAFVTEADKAYAFKFKVVGPAPATTEWNLTASHNVDGSLDLPYGKYTITETDIPNGFSAVIDKNGFTIGGQTTKVTVKAYNTKLVGKLTVDKTVTGPFVNSLDKLNFYKFKVVGPAPATTEWSVLANDSVNGLLLLPYGTYTISEVDVPHGFVATFDKTTFTVSGDPVEVNATNTKQQGTLTVDKVVAGDNVTDDEKAFNYKFIVAGPIGSLAYDTYTVYANDATNGTLNLPYGTYSITEVNVSGKFTASLSTDRFTIGPNSAQVTVTATNTKKNGTLTVDKVLSGKYFADADRKFPFRFEIAGPAGSESKTWTVTASDLADGTLTLPYGNYTIQEVDIPSGYDASLSATSFTIGAQSTAITITATNTQRLGKLTVSKVLEGMNLNEDDNARDYTFRVLNTGNGLDWTVTIKGAGSDTVDLPYGDYTIEETNIPNGFSATLSQTSFTIGGETVEVTVNASNYKESRKVTIDKVVDGPNVSEQEKAREYEFKIVGPAPAVTVWTIKSTDRSSGTLELPFGDYTVEELNVPADYQSVLSTGSFTIDAKTEAVDITATNTKQHGSLMLTKDVDGAAEEDMTQFNFLITGPNDYSKTVSLIHGGTVTLDELAWGDYTITEADMPEGYRSLDEPQTITIGTENREVTLTYHNQKLGTIHLIKTDSATGLPVAGVVLSIAAIAEPLEQPSEQPAQTPASNSGREPILVTTNAQGLADVKDLLPGTYTITEISAPNGYVPGAPQTVVLAAGQTAEVTFRNDPQGFLKLIKTDAVSGAALADAEFSLADNAEFTNAIALTTLADGTVTTAALIPGTWYLKETKAPNGYVLETAVKTVVIALGQTTEVPLTNRMIPGQLQLIKVDAADATLLQGATFNFYSDAALNTLAASGTTDANGQINLTDLRPGTYWVLETKAPSGYTLNSTAVSVTVSSNNRSILTLTNQKDDTLGFEDEKGQLNLLKVDGYSKKPLANAKFSLYSDAAKQTLISTGVTGADGIIEFKSLTPGTFYLVETSAPAGYKLNINTVPVNVTAGQITNLTVTNELNDTKDYQTGSMEYNYLIGGGAVLLLGAGLILITRRRRATTKK